MKVMKILSAIVSKNAPVFEDTSHFLASRPSKKSVQAAIKAIRDPGYEGCHQNDRHQ